MLVLGLVQNKKEWMMFSEPNQKNNDLSALSLDELNKELENIGKQIQAQETSNKMCQNKGIIPPYIQEKLLTYYQNRKSAIEDAIRNHLQSSNLKPT